MSTSKRDGAAVAASRVGLLHVGILLFPGNLTIPQPCARRVFRSDNGRPALRQGNVTESEIPHSRQGGDHATNQPIDAATRAAGRRIGRDLRRASSRQRADQRLASAARRAKPITSSRLRAAGEHPQTPWGEPDIQAQLNMMQAAGVPLERCANSYRAALAAGRRAAGRARGRCRRAGSAVRHEQEVAHGRGVRPAHGGVAHARRREPAVRRAGQPRPRDDDGSDRSEHSAAADESHRRVPRTGCCRR